VKKQFTFITNLVAKRLKKIINKKSLNISELTELSYFVAKQEELLLKKIKLKKSIKKWN